MPHAIRPRRLPALHRLVLLLAVVAAAIPLPAPAAVITVPTDFALIADAIAAAADGDTIEILPEQPVHSEVVFIDGRRLTLRGVDPTGERVKLVSTFNTPMTIRGGADVTLAGLHIFPNFAFTGVHNGVKVEAGSTLIASDCDLAYLYVDDAALVRVENSDIGPSHMQAPTGVSTRVEFTNVVALQTNAIAIDAFVAMHSVLTGLPGYTPEFPQEGGGVAGGSGLRAEDIRLVTLAGCTLTGGRGGDARGCIDVLTCHRGGDGGIGLWVTGCPEVTVTECVVRGGNGGFNPARVGFAGDGGAGCLAEIGSIVGGACATFVGGLPGGSGGEVGDDVVTFSGSTVSPDPCGSSSGVVVR